MAQIKQFIFFDFEMLCSNRGMPFENMEAIRLGAVKYDLETKTITSFDRFIRPTKLKPLSDFCKKLTGIQDHQLVSAHNFKEVFGDFLTWIGGVKKSRFFSWSKSDIIRLKMDAEIHNISLSTIKKIEKRYIDFQEIFTNRVSKTQVSVENALALYGLVFVGEKHNPMYDAYNTLLIYLSFSNRKLESDQIMLRRFFPEMECSDKKLIQPLLLNKLKQDVEELVGELKNIYYLKDGKKMLKKIQRLVKKYENIVINRSGIFSKELIHQVQLLVDFYNEWLLSYEDHARYSSRVMILDDHIIDPIVSLAK